MSMYLIKSALCLLLLWAFYKLALEHLAAHQFKRFYLLGSLLLSLVLPLLTFTYEVPVVNEVASNPMSTVATPVKFTQAEASKTDWLSIALYSIYGLGALVFGFRFLRNMSELCSKIRQNIHISQSKSILVLLEENSIPHSFLNYIFLPRKDFDTNRIAPEILRHEQAHVSQKHTLDVLFIEILQVIFWFNPLFYLVKKSIILNHEFLADQQAVKQVEEHQDYINLLFNYAQGTHHARFTSAFDYSFTRPPYRRAKKRILMISQSFSARKLVTRLAFLLPVLAFCIYFFNQEIIAKPVVQEKHQLSNDRTIEKAILKITINQENITVNGRETTTDHFIKTINEITANWTEEEMMNYSIQLRSKNGVDATLGELMKAFRKTRLYKTNPSQELIPPPPPPAPVAPEAPATPSQPQRVENLITVEVDGQQISWNENITDLEDFAKTMNAFTDGWSEEEFKNTAFTLMMYHSSDTFYEKLKTAFTKTDFYDKTGRNFLSPPPPPPAPKAPPAPPEAPNPQELIDEMISKQASFYYNGDLITGEKAKKLFKNKSNLNFMATENDDQPMVLITDQ